MNAELYNVETALLLCELRKYRKALGYSLADIPDFSPDLCMHRIHLEDESMTSVEHQRRLNPNLKDVVKKEIMKLLEVGVIYDISDSKWVGHVHVVPKKGGITVITNEKNELIPTRTVTRHRMCIDFEDKILHVSAQQEFHHETNWRMLSNQSWIQQTKQHSKWPPDHQVITCWKNMSVWINSKR